LVESSEFLFIIVSASRGRSIGGGGTRGGGGAPGKGGGRGLAPDPFCGRPYHYPVFHTYAGRQGRRPKIPLKEGMDAREVVRQRPRQGLSELMGKEGIQGQEEIEDCTEGQEEKMRATTARDGGREQID